MADGADLSDGGRPSNSFSTVTRSWRRWWRMSVVGTVDKAQVIADRREEAYLSPRYLFMTAMSAGIAVLGLLLSSPAVVIGAMLIAPLMGPIIGLGFALAIGDYGWVRGSAKSLVAGTILGIALCGLIVFVSPLQTITPEIASRTRPNLFDLLVALFSGMAGAYAMIRGRAGTVVGVAIATALMPPIAVVGFGMATLNWTVFSGALLLFVTNLVTIALTAWGMAKLYGFTGALSDRNTQLQSFIIIAVFIGLAVPLALTLRQIAWEANAARQVRGELETRFGPAARLSQPEIAFDTDPLTVSAFVWTTELKPDAEAQAEKEMSERLGRRVDFDLRQFLVRDQSSAEQAQLAAAAAQEEEAQSQRLKNLAQRLSLAAGVPEGEVTVDRQRRRAVVRARPLPGASLATYRALERRIAASEPNWTIELIPPAGQLLPIAFEERLPGEAEEEGQDAPVMAPTQRGAEALALAGWAARRLGAPLELSGPRELVATASAELEGQGIAVREGAIGGGGATVTPRFGSLDGG